MQDACDSSLVVGATPVGVIGEPVAHSAKTKTITGSRRWQSKENVACGLTVARRVEAISRVTLARAASEYCWQTGLHFISISSPEIAGLNGSLHPCTNFNPV